jgi:hypothetical protein
MVCKLLNNGSTTKNFFERYGNSVAKNMETRKSFQGQDLATVISQHSNMDIDMIDEEIT